MTISDTTLAQRHPLEAYADSYAQMNRTGYVTVDCRSVEADIRQNMIPVTVAADELDRLTEANQALEAELASTEEDRDRIRHERGLYCLAKQRAETKLAKVEAERDDWRKLHDAAQRVVSERNAALNVLSAELAEARRVIEPFSDIAGEMFSRGWDASNVALALDNPDDPHRVTAGDFFTARSFLALEEKP